MNHTTEQFPRRMGDRVRGAEYASALSGPRPGRIREALAWIAAVLLPFAVGLFIHWSY